MLKTVSPLSNAIAALYTRAHGMPVQTRLRLLLVLATEVH